MNVEKDRHLRESFAHAALVIAPITGIIAGIIASVYRMDMRSQVAALLLTFCAATLAAAVVIRAIGWVVRRCVAEDGDKREHVMNEKGPE